jgi:hypothetical protein
VGNLKKFRFHGCAFPSSEDEDKEKKKEENE